MSENSDRKRGDRYTDTDEFIICPMLYYSNGTDKNLDLFYNPGYQQ